ncbi:basic proline-rich protein-like [Artibeus jamaicensis]|uniref:basic proline-rich protein-like n=1 Tax=Artibeus jamaicensis TaxID=9417 RepID=UPI00235B27F3|nr:basic proline-rich protein-like [Artibeus jamaicensis]
MLSESAHSAGPQLDVPRLLSSPGVPSPGDGPRRPDSVGPRPRTPLAAEARRRQPRGGAECQRGPTPARTPPRQRGSSPSAGPAPLRPTCPPFSHPLLHSHRTGCQKGNVGISLHKKHSVHSFVGLLTEPPCRASELGDTSGGGCRQSPTAAESRARRPRSGRRRGTSPPEVSPDRLSRPRPPSAFSFPRRQSAPRGAGGGNPESDPLGARGFAAAAGRSAPRGTLRAARGECERPGARGTKPAARSPEEAPAPAPPTRGHPNGPGCQRAGAGGRAPGARPRGSPPAPGSPGRKGQLRSSRGLRRLQPARSEARPPELPPPAPSESPGPARATGWHPALCPALLGALAPTSSPQSPKTPPAGRRVRPRPPRHFPVPTAPHSAELRQTLPTAPGPPPPLPSPAPAYRG